MRLFLYLLWIILIVFGATFAVLNSQSIPVDYFLGQKTIYFPLLFLFLLFVGVLLGVIVLLPTIIKLKTQIHFLKQKVKTLNMHE